MALTLTSSQLKHDAKNVARGAATPAGVAAATALAAHSVMTNLAGARRVGVDTDLCPLHVSADAEKTTNDRWAQVDDLFDRTEWEPRQ